MPKSPERKKEELRKALHPNQPPDYDLSHVSLPPIHPSPEVSLKLIEELTRIISPKVDVYKEFTSHYQTLDIEQRYFFCQYYLSYHFDSVYGHSYIHRTLFSKYFEENARIEKNDGYLKYLSLQEQKVLWRNYTNKLSEISKTDQFIKSELQSLKWQMYRIYNLPKHKNIHFQSHYSEKLQRRLFRNIDISNNANEYIYKAREILTTKMSSEEADLFIYNSFNFPTNEKIRTFLSMDSAFGKASGKLMFLLFDSHRNIVKKPKATKLHFAEIMYVNFQYVRNNWAELQKRKYNATLEDFLSSSVVGYIRQ
ncbi:MAG TPA: hypothetical protein VFM70_04500 [Salinimicrobium sp.]|nr:hypothetical protein [Salinimicrobium sp.]